MKLDDKNYKTSDKVNLSSTRVDISKFRVRLLVPLITFHTASMMLYTIHSFLCLRYDVSAPSTVFRARVKTVRATVKVAHPAKGPLRESFGTADGLQG